MSIGVLPISARIQSGRIVGPENAVVYFIRCRGDAARIGMSIASDLLEALGELATAQERGSSLESLATLGRSVDATVRRMNEFAASTLRPDSITNRLSLAGIIAVRIELPYSPESQHPGPFFASVRGSVCARIASCFCY